MTDLQMSVKIISNFISFRECISRCSLSPVSCGGCLYTSLSDRDRLQILLMDTCRLYGSRSVVVRIHSQLIWQGAVCVGLKTRALTCPETI